MPNTQKKMRLPANFAIFLGIFLLFLFIADLTVFQTILFALRIVSHAFQYALAILLCVLTFGFIASLFLGTKQYNKLTRLTYILTATWMGAFAYFFFASVLIGILALLPLPLPILQYIGLGLLVASLFISVYGIIHARDIKIRRVTISLPHLPSLWNTRSIVWISDVHLGQVYGKTFTAKIVRNIQALKPDIVFIGGDLFDGTQAPPLADFISPLRDLTIPLGTYFISGNHEEFGNGATFFQTIKDAGIHILDDEKIVVDGLQIIGVDYKKATVREAFMHTLTRLSIDKNAPSILLKHVPDNLDIAESTGISLQISGHTHYGQQFPFGLIASRIYKGFAWGLKSLGTMQVYTSSGVGTWGSPLRVGSDSEIVVFHFKNS